MNGTSTAYNYIVFGNAGLIYNEGTIFRPAITIAAKGTFNVLWEIDWRRNMVRKDMALTAWANGPGIIIK